MLIPVSGKFSYTTKLAVFRPQERHKQHTLGFVVVVCVCVVHQGVSGSACLVQIRAPIPLDK